ncbi:hypothetical protein G2W53_034332 [Senna tora]|uniref:Uncharacterized protein n=1 Tax=Senna tora TaxID=362788 RepID=A0A834T147_9FABA|nr:hypothetical protein G2W53_034332 [Senna tora]
MRAPSAILRTLNFRRIQPPSAVAPLPEKTPFDEQLTAELDNLQQQEGGDSVAVDGLIQLLDASIATQKIALEMFVKIPHRENADRRAIEDYLESNVEILDACNYFVDRIEMVKKYLDSLRVVLRLIDSAGSCGFDPNETAKTTRALEHLESCRGIERKCKCDINNKRLRRMLRQNDDDDDDKEEEQETELTEIMCGSKAMALMACRFLELGLSFDAKRRFSTRTSSSSSSFQRRTSSSSSSSSWLRILRKRRSESCLVMSELKETVNSARKLQEQIKGKKKEKEVKCAVEGLKRNWKGLEDRLEMIEERVKDFAHHVIHFGYLESNSLKCIMPAVQP